MSDDISITEDPNPDKVERYSKEDFLRALEMSDLRNAPRMVERIEVARSQRLGYIRKATMDAIGEDDRGKTVYISGLRSPSRLLTDFKKYDTFSGSVFLVLDGFVEQYSKTETIYVDDSSTPKDADA